MKHLLGLICHWPLSLTWLPYKALFPLSHPLSAPLSLHSQNSVKYTKLNYTQSGYFVPHHFLWTLSKSLCFSLLASLSSSLNGRWTTWFVSPSLERAFYSSRYFWFLTQPLTQRDYLINIVVLVNESNDAMNSSIKGCLAWGANRDLVLSPDCVTSLLAELGQLLLLSKATEGMSFTQVHTAGQRRARAETHVFWFSSTMLHCLKIRSFFNGEGIKDPLISLLSPDPGVTATPANSRNKTCL